MIFNFLLVGAVFLYTLTSNYSVSHGQQNKVVMYEIGHSQKYAFQLIDCLQYN